MHYVQDGFKFAVIVVHIDPDDVFCELNALYGVIDGCLERVKTKVRHDCFVSSLKNVLILGDMNADCRYLPLNLRNRLKLRKDNSFKWLIGDEEDTTVGNTDCAYDRFVFANLSLMIKYIELFYFADLSQKVKHGISAFHLLVFLTSKKNTI